MRWERLKNFVKGRSKTMGLFGKKKPALREASVESVGEALSTQGLSCSQLSTGGLLTQVNGVLFTSLIRARTLVLVG